MNKKTLTISAILACFFLAVGFKENEAAIALQNITKQFHTDLNQMTASNASMKTAVERLDGSTASALAVQELVADCGPVVQQLIDRYDLKGRNLMSVGAGGAFEEMAMLDRGVRRAFLFDIDEHDSLGRILPPLPQADPATAPVVYVLDDFTKVQPDSKDMDPIALLYFSGFTAADVRRGAVRYT